jgi:hypothetical protein
MSGVDHYEEDPFADQSALIEWLTPEELERFAEAEEASKSAHRAIIKLTRQVLARENAACSSTSWSRNCPAIPKVGKPGEAVLWQRCLSSAVSRL